jgi:hypothetical protein
MSNPALTDNEVSTREEREELAAKTEVAVKNPWMVKYSQEWKEVLALILEKCYVDQSFFNRVIKDFATNSWATSNFAKEAMKSFRAGIAVYGKLSVKTPIEKKADGSDKLSQFELAMSILRQHPSTLIENYAADVGIVLNDEGEKLPY